MLFEGVWAGGEVVVRAVDAAEDEAGVMGVVMVVVALMGMNPAEATFHQREKNDAKRILEEDEGEIGNKDIWKQKKRNEGRKNGDSRGTAALRQVDSAPNTNTKRNEAQAVGGVVPMLQVLWMRRCTGLKRVPFLFYAPKYNCAAIKRMNQRTGKPIVSVSPALA